LVVGSFVSLGHYLAPGASWWPIIHFLLPVTVFSRSAWKSGHRTITAGLALRGVATVVIVGISFTAINTVWTLAPVVRGALNYLVPFLVTLAGSAGSRDLKYPARPPRPRAP
jgi:hypothetical protein